MWKSPTKNRVVTLGSWILWGRDDSKLRIGSMSAPIRMKMFFSCNVARSKANDFQAKFSQWLARHAPSKIGGPRFGLPHDIIHWSPSENAFLLLKDTAKHRVKPSRPGGFSFTGWWFGCHQIYFPRNIGFLIIIPIDEQKCFSEGFFPGPPSSLNRSPLTPCWSGKIGIPAGVDACHGSIHLMNHWLINVNN